MKALKKPTIFISSCNERFCTKKYTLLDFEKVKQSMKIKDLVEFQSKNKYLFMSYNQNTLRELGNIVANHNKLNKEEVIKTYEKILIKLLSKEPTHKQCINALDHIYGYFKGDITEAEKAYYFKIQKQYLNNKTTYSDILSLLLEWSIKFKKDYLINQTILTPYSVD